jgi:hypothetical protein
MKRFFAAIICIGLVGAPAVAQDPVSQAARLEASGDSLGARRVLEEAAQSPGASASTLEAFARFLDSYRAPGAHDAWVKAAAQLTGSRKTAALKRVVLLDLLAADRATAAKSLDAYQSAGGADLGNSLPAPAAPAEIAYTEIPGPLPSFARMAALSPDLKPEELLPALARNVVTNGYQASNSNEGLEQTEFLRLVFRYLSQARELDKLAGPEHKLAIENCDSPKTGELLRILGYRMRGGCGGEVVLETVNASRAFLTIDSGFPIAEFELALRTNRPFVYDYSPTRLPVLYGPDYWMGGKERQRGDFIDSYLGDPTLCRLYLGMSKLDPETADALKKQAVIGRLRAFAHVLDFFGGMFLIRDGKATVPGAPRTNAVWAELVGSSPDNGAEFYDKLIAKDDGWLTSYYDALMRIEGPAKDYLCEPDRMKRFYAALRGRVTSPGPARPVFRSNTDLMLLTTRLRMVSPAEPHVPGGIEVWKNLFLVHPHGKYDGKLTKLATGWKTPDDVLEALFGLCRKAVENEPLKIFMAISDLNRVRSKPVEPATVDRIMNDFRMFGSQLPVFAELGELTDKSIIQFLDTARALNSVRDQGTRAEAAGTFQALIGLWQVFVRNRLIPSAQAEAEFAALTAAFAKARDDASIFEAGRNGIVSLLKAAGAASGSAQDRMLDLIAGTLRPADAEAHLFMLQDMTRSFESQKLISLKTILDIADHSEAVGKGEKPNTALLSRLATRLNELQLPRASLTGVEKNSLSFGYWTERHIERQRRLNVRADIESAGADPNKQREARGKLTPLLRDTLVGFNYLYYAPPRAQILKTNPLFVRSHDFIGVQGSNQTWRPTEVLGSGWPSSAGGRLVGSLAGLGYALAEAEQNFLVPSREQALIWGDLVPQMILSAKGARWWSVTPAEMHWVGVRLREGEMQVAESVLNAEVRKRLIATLARHAAPNRVTKTERLLASGELSAALENITPSELLQLGLGAGEATDSKMLASVSQAFGTPKPTLTNSYRPELLFLRTFPTLMGYSSRIMAESWESNTIYFAALADELSLSPGRLNVVVPQWTASTVERIFATHLEDWPALLRSLRRVGDDIRAGGRQAVLAGTPTGE